MIEAILEKFGDTWTMISGSTDDVGVIEKDQEKLIDQALSQIKAELIVEIDKLQEITLTERGFGGTLVIKSNLVDKSQIIEIIEKA